MRKFLLLAFYFFNSTILQACAVCFGSDDANLSRGFFWGVVFLGALPFLLMGGFVSYLVYFTSKRKP